jgi:hypothetical protein
MDVSCEYFFIKARSKFCHAESLLAHVSMAGKLGGMSIAHAQIQIGVPVAAMLALWRRIAAHDYSF